MHSNITKVPLVSHDIVKLEYGTPYPKPDDASTYHFPANFRQWWVKKLDVPSAVWYYVFGLLRLRFEVRPLSIIWNKHLTSSVSLWCLYQERSHSGLVRRFAKPLRWKRLREFESLPLRHWYSPTWILIDHFRGVAQLAEHSTPNRAVGGSIPLAPAKTPEQLKFRSFYFFYNFLADKDTHRLRCSELVL